jgi:hypothetical protein
MTVHLFFCLTPPCAACPSFMAPIAAAPDLVIVQKVPAFFGLASAAADVTLAGDDVLAPPLAVASPVPPIDPPSVSPPAVVV